MTFLNPLMFWGLAAVSIPILIHIFNLKRTKKIDFSTLMFLKEIQQSKYKKIKLKQLLILLCRIAFIIFLVLMFSKPYDKGFLGTPGSNIKSSVLIILDNSISMQSRNATGSELETGKKKINELLDASADGDEIFFTSVSGLNSPAAKLPYNDIGAIRDSLNSMKISAVSLNLDEILYYAEEILKSSSHSRTEIYFVTDGQSSFIKSENMIRKVFRDRENLSLNFILTGNRNANNLSVDTINIVTKIFETNRPVKIKASVTNHNSFNVLNKSLILNFGSHKEEKIIDIPAGTTIETEFTFKPGTYGFLSGNAELVQNEISDDEISGDNKQYFAFYIPHTVNLLISGSSPADAEYVKLALRSSEELSPGNIESTVFNIKENYTGSIANEDLNNYSSIIFVNKPGFTASETSLLKHFVEAGRGLVIFPGFNSDILNYNNMLMNMMDLPYIGNKYIPQINSSFDKIDYEHPVIEGIFRKSGVNNFINIEPPEMKTGFQLFSGNNSQSIITMTDGNNFMNEYFYGKGKIIMFALPAEMNSSDFPSKNLFSPLTVRSILYAANVNTIKPAIAGKDYFINVNSSKDSADSLFIINTHAPGSRIKLYETTGLFNTGKFLNESAIYNITSGNNVINTVPVNFIKSESEMKRTSPDDIKKTMADKYQLEVNIISASEPVTASVMGMRTGRDLWSYFLILAIISLIFEYLLSRSIIKANKI